MPLSATSKRPRCSVCSVPLDVHQVVRGGVCDNAACRGTAARRAIERQQAEKTAAHESAARARLPELLAESSLRDSEVALIAVPAVIAPLSAPATERRERFRASVNAAVAAAAAEASVAPGGECDSDSDPVRSAACGVCRGSCCRSGGDTAYIDAAVVQRIRALHPGLDDTQIVAMFMSAIPERTVEGSCILHGELGCTLPREHRSDVCNNFYCQPIRNWERAAAREEPRPVAVFALHENEVIRSVLIEGDP